MYHLPLPDPDLPRRSQAYRTYLQTNKCGIDLSKEGTIKELFGCMARNANGSKIYLATDHTGLAKLAAHYFGTQLLPAPAGVPRHTGRALPLLHNVSASPQDVDDVHIMSMADFVLLGSASRLFLTCGTFGETARDRSLRQKHFSLRCSSLSIRR